MKRLSLVLVLTIPITGCGSIDIPFAAKASSAGILSLELGDATEAVEASIGTPYRRGPYVGRMMGTGDSVDELFFYNGLPPEEPSRFSDIFEIGFSNGRLVGAISHRRFGGRDVRVGSDNPEVVFRLLRKADGSVERVIGPLFEEVFRCEPGFIRPPADAAP